MILRVIEHLKVASDVVGGVTGTVADLIKMTIKIIRPRVIEDGEADEGTGASTTEDTLSAIQEDLRRKVTLAYIRHMSAPPRLEAEIATTEVREVGSSEMLARVKMRVTEDGVEWATVVDRDGELVARLVSE